MIAWIGVVLVLFVMQTLLAPSIQYLGGTSSWAQKLKTALGPRDNPPAAPLMAQRADRALKNMMEALPVFLTLALLCVVTGRDDDTARVGAMVFFLARAAYVPSYLVGVSGLRSAIWAIGWVGLAMMIAALMR